MTLDEIFGHWDQDSRIDSTKLGDESLNIPKLHNKYYRMLSNERMMLRKQESELSELKNLKTDYYSGVLPYETLKELSWEPFQLKLLKSDISNKLHSDKHIIQKTLHISMQVEKVDILIDILKMIHTRNFQIKNAIDYMKFTNGV